MERFLNHDTNRWVSLGSISHKRLIKAGKVDCRGNWLEKIKIIDISKTKEIPDEKLSIDEIYKKYNVFDEDENKEEIKDLEIVL